MNAGLAVFLATAALALGCTSRTVPEDPGRIAKLQQSYDELHSRLEKATEKDPIIAKAFAERGQVVMALRAGLIQQLAGDVAARYLDTVTVDLKDVKAKGSGDLGKDTFLGHIKIGEWKVNLRLGTLAGHLRVGKPQVSLRGPNLIDIKLPVDVQETEGDARLFFSWDSSALANVVCKDFELDREIRGRILPQHHVLSGSLLLNNTGEELVATPLFPDRRVQLKLDLTPKSWKIVESALQSQNQSGKCGTLMKPGRDLGFLRELAAKGISVKLPDSIFRTVTLPGRYQEAVKVDNKRVGLGIHAESLKIDAATLWSSASIQVQAAVRR